MKKVWITIVVIVIVLGGAAAYWFLAGPGSDNDNGTNNNGTSQPVQPTAEQRIRDNWTTFFSGDTPAQKKIDLLQNGSQFADAIKAQSQSETAKSTSATVSDVQLNGADKATVTYGINLNGKSALQNQKGQAVLIDGVWKVSTQAFCNLLQLSGNVPEQCPSSSQSNGTNTNGTENTNGTSGSSQQSGGTQNGAGQTQPQSTGTSSQ